MFAVSARTPQSVLTMNRDNHGSANQEWHTGLLAEICVPAEGMVCSSPNHAFEYIS